MKIHVPIVIVLIIAAFAGGWYTSQQLSIQTTTQQPQAQPATKQADTAATEPIEIYSGSGMSPAKLYDTLDTLTGTDFDKRYINYVILMQSNMVGINRLAKEKAVAPDLKQRATDLWALDDQRLSDLYALQKQLGYSHH